MTIDSESGRFWDDPRVEFVTQCILSSYPQLLLGEKFDKLFQTEATRYVQVFQLSHVFKKY